MKNTTPFYLVLNLVLTLSVLDGQALFQGQNHPVNARGWGMGSAVSSQSKDASGILYNPAVIVHSENQWQANYTNFPLDISSNTAYTIFKMPVQGKFAIMFNYLNYGLFTERDDQNIETGSFSVYDLASSIAYSRKITRRLSLGLSTQYIQSRLNSLSSSAFLGSFGILYFDEISTLSIGLSYRNFGIMMETYSGGDEKMADSFILGISKKLAHLPMILSVDVWNTAPGDYLANIGGEFLVGDHMFLRWGNSTKRFQIRGQENFKNFFTAASGGMGIKFRSFQFDLAVSSLSDAGTISSFSISQIL